MSSLILSYKKRKSWKIHYFFRAKHAARHKCLDRVKVIRKSVISNDCSGFIQNTSKLLNLQKLLPGKGLHDSWTEQFFKTHSKAPVSVFLIKFQALTLIQRDSSSRTPLKRKAATGSVLWKKLVLKISQYAQGKTPELESLLKLDSHLPKKFCFICFTESPLKMMKNAFYFILKALLVLKVFKFLSWLFAHVEKTAWLER